MSKKLELSGKTFGRLTVLEFVGNSSNGKRMWSCSCSCGKQLDIVGSSLTSGNTSSCGCYKLEMTSLKLSKHRMSGTSEYNSWFDMKRRCLDEKNDHYKDYAGRGITVHPDFIESFSKWYEEVGEKPNKTQKWSIGRIDNNGSYTYGNIRWELCTTQARNHSMQVNNTSGIVGVGYRTKGNYWYAQWLDLFGIKRSKCFSCSVYPNAKELAVEYRVKVVEELNNQGAGYAESHGSPKSITKGIK
jgi:hypothetical protein